MDGDWDEVRDSLAVSQLRRAPWISRLQSSFRGDNCSALANTAC